MRVAGLTCVQTYVEWSSHQPNPEETIFKDNLDIEEFLQAAADTGLGITQPKVRNSCIADIEINA